MGKGGMRFGAGRPAYRGKAEACLRLDVRQMARSEVLRAGSQGTWRWHNTATGEHAGEIGYRVESGALVLDYALNGEPRQPRVPLLRTPCNYGGSRPWLGCPHCGARVAVLYLRRGGFYCRKCAQVSYRSQCEDACGRSWIKQRKAEAKLGPHWSRPKGMHHKTRERLLQTIWRCEEARDEYLAGAMAWMGWTI